MAQKARRRPRPPEDLKYLLRWYDDIRTGQSAGMSHNPISHQEIWSYRELYGMDMDAFDVDTLRRLDALWLSCLPKEGE